MRLMNVLKKLRNYLFYCGIEKEEYNAVKEDVYTSNFVIWRVLHCMMSALFGFLFIYSLFADLFKSNTYFYLGIFLYSLTNTVVFFTLKKSSKLTQGLIYLSIGVLFLFGCLITQNKPDTSATLFFILLLITPMFMLDQPFIMGFLLVAVSAVFSLWMYKVKPFDVWQMDFIDAITYTIVGIFIHIIVNAVRIREFVLTRKINIQKDTDDLTGLKNKGALTHAINEFLTDKSKDKGIMLMLDINDFKSVNDTYGHDVGDRVINQFGDFLASIFKEDDIVGRFGGDEFIVFIKNSDNLDAAATAARAIIGGVSDHVKLPDEEKPIGVSIGIAIYHGKENHYSEVFKKADVALYKAKANRSIGYNICL